MKKSVKVRFITAAAAAAAAGGATIAAYNSTAFANWYSLNIYPVIQKISSFISGLFPFSVAEILLILLVTAVLGFAVFGFIRLIIKLVKRKKSEKKPLKPRILSAASTVSLIASLTAFIFVFNCGINYYRSPFSAYSGLEIQKYSKEQLHEVLVYMIIEANKLVQEIELGENGLCILPENHLDTETQAMRKLAEKYPVMNAYFPNAKPVAILSPLWCYTKIVGMFVPFTMEANYNTCDTTESIGHNICHELSHLTGFMREDEANFVAYLACRESDDPYLRYSGYLATINYLLNAYYPEVELEEYLDTYALIHPVIKEQNNYASKYWSQFNTPVAEVSNTINDTYLKINNQTDGTKSYGRMVDLVIADYYQNIKEN